MNENKDESTQTKGSSTESLSSDGKSKEKNSTRSSSTESTTSDAKIIIKRKEKQRRTPAEKEKAAENLLKEWQTKFAFNFPYTFSGEEEEVGGDELAR